MFTITSAPASLWTAMGPTGYQISSQIFTPTPYPIDGVHGADVPPLEVAVLVENPVGWEVHLVVHPCKLSLVGYGGSIVYIGVGVYEAYHYSNISGSCHDPAHGFHVVLDKGGLEEEVLRRVAGDGHLRKGHQVRTQGAGFFYQVDNLPGVPSRSPTVGLI